MSHTLFLYRKKNTAVGKKLSMVFWCFQRVQKANNEKKWVKECPFRGSGPEVFCKEGVTEIFSKFTEKYLYHRLLFTEVAHWWSATLLKRDSRKGVFPRILRNSEERPLRKTPANGCFLPLPYICYNINVLPK